MSSAARSPLALVEAQRDSLSDPPLATAIPTDRFGDYRGYAGVLDAIIAAAGRGARLELLGHSVNGEPLCGLGIGPADSPRMSLVLGGMHAMEWIGIEVGLALIDALLAKPPQDRQILLVPLLNPDGMRQAEANLRTNRWRFVRANARGVDLNRNWPTFYRTSNWPGTLLPPLGSAGRSACSEPEVAAICQRLDQARDRDIRCDLALSLHSVGPAILYPFGGRWKLPEQDAAFRDTANQIAQRLPIRYKVTPVSRWVPGISFAHGMEIDHLHRHYGSHALLVECSAGGCLLRDPSSWLHPFRWFNPPQRGAVVAGLLPPLEDFVRGLIPSTP